jgi:hypothetical protein
MQARLIPAARGAFWIISGLHLFRRNPPLLSMLTFFNMLLALVLSQLQPIGPLLLLLFSPLIMAAIASACDVIWHGAPLQTPLQPIFARLEGQGRSLLRLGVIQLIYVTLVVALASWLLPGLEAEALAGAADADTPEKAAQVAAQLRPEDLALLFMHLGAVMLMVLPAFWFAPLLTAWHGIAPLKAVFFSWVAVWRNWRAFLAYAVATAVIGALLPGLLQLLLAQLSPAVAEVMGAVVRLLLLLVMAPVLMTGAYCAYQDIFVSMAVEPPVVEGNAQDGTNA